MKLLIFDVVLLLLIATAWMSQPVSSTSSSSSSSTDSHKGGNQETDLASPRRRGIGGFSPFRPIMRMLGIMGLPLLPIILIRQLVAGGAGGTAPNFGGGGGGLSFLNALGGAGGGTGLGGLRPFGQGLRPFGGGLRPLGGGGLRPLGGILGGTSNPGQAAGAAGTAGNAAAALFLRKRSLNPPETKFTNFLSTLVKLEKVFDRYDISVPDCQRMLVCEVHRRGLSPSIGSFAEKMIQAFGVEARLERSSFTSNTKSVLKEFLLAARHGLMQKTCSELYSKCPMAVKQHSPIRRGKI